MDVGTVTACMIGVNRDGLTPCRLAMCMVSDPTDIRTVQLIGPVDHWPVVGAKLLILEIEDAWEVGIVLDEIMAAVTTLIGDRVTAACSAVGVAAPFSQISQRAVPNALGGQIELGGLADWVVAFTDLKTAFDQLKADLNSHIQKYNTHIHIGTATVDAGPVGTIAATTATSTPTTADMTAAKVTTVMVP